MSFAFPEDLELFQVEAEVDEGELAELLRQRPAFTFEEAVRASGLRTAEVARELWRLVWAGRLTNDTWAALRKGAQRRFEVEQGAQSRHTRRRGFDRWRASRPFQGTWRVLDPPEAPSDAIDAIERERDRVRVLLERYGLLFRELLLRELPALQWGKLFRALRLMELSGEVVGGHFFQALPGPQFASHDALRLLRELDEDALRQRVWWVNAADPAASTGLRLPELGLPSRLPTTWLVYRGGDLALVARSGGEKLDVLLAHDHPDLPRCLGLFKRWLGRGFQPVSRVVVSEINGEAATGSEYAPALQEFGFTRDYKALVLQRRY